MAEPHCFVSHQSGECRSDLDCTGGIISDTEEISENRNCHDNRIAAWAAGNKYTAEKLGVPAKALCCHTPAECACNGCRLVVPLRSFHQFHGCGSGDILPDAQKNRYSCDNFGSVDLSVQTVCGSSLSVGCGLRRFDWRSGCIVRP